MTEKADNPRGLVWIGVDREGDKAQFHFQGDGPDRSNLTIQAARTPNGTEVFRTTGFTTEPEEISPEGSRITRLTLDTDPLTEEGQLAVAEILARAAAEISQIPRIDSRPDLSTPHLPANE